MKILLLVFASFEVEIVQPCSQLVLLVLLRRRRGLMILVFRGAFNHLVQPLHDRSPLPDARFVVVQNGPGGQDREGLLVRYTCELQELSRQFPFLQNRL